MVQNLLKLTMFMEYTSRILQQTLITPYIIIFGIMKQLLFLPILMGITQ